MSTQDLEGTVRRLSDKDEIVDLIHRYSFLVDHMIIDRGLVAEFIDLFTEDCHIDYGPGMGPTVESRAAFSAMLNRTPDPDNRGGFLATSHHNANVLITFETDDRARVVTSLYAWHLIPSGETPRVWGYYHDIVERTPHGWRFAERKLRIGGSQAWAPAMYPLIDAPGA